MKKIFLVILGCLVALILLFFIVYKVIHPSPSPSSTNSSSDSFKSATVATNSIVADTPSHAALSCYAWYLDLYAKGTLSALEIGTSDGASSCFTDSFLRQWETITNESGLDPVLLAQDYQSTWLKNIMASVLAETTSASDIKVTIGTEDETINIVTHLIRIGSVWKIDSVTSS